MPRRETEPLRANMARSQRAENSGRTTTSPGLLTVYGRRTHRAAENLLAGSRKAPGAAAGRAILTEPGGEKTVVKRKIRFIERRKRQAGPGKSCIPPGISWTRRRPNGRQRSLPGLRRKPFGEPGPRHGSTSTTKSIRWNRKTWAWREPINRSWQPRARPAG